MKYQKGAALNSIIFILSLVIIVCGYLLYKQKVSVKHPEQIIVQQDSQNKNSTQEVVKVVQNNVPINCENNLECLISAVKECKPVNGTISINNIPFPLMDGVLVAGTTNYEIIKGNTDCIAKSTNLSTLFTLSDTARLKMANNGMTAAQIDAQIKSMNDSTALTIGKVTSCAGNGLTLASYIQEQMKGGANLRFEISTSTGKSQSIVTVPSGEKVVCTVQ